MMENNFIPGPDPAGTKKKSSKGFIFIIVVAVPLVLALLIIILSAVVLLQPLGIYFIFQNFRFKRFEASQEREIDELTETLEKRTRQLKKYIKAS